MAIQQIREQDYNRQRFDERQTVEERSLGDLFSELSTEISTLFRYELQLARAELTQKVTKAGRNIAFVAMGGAIAYAGVLALVAAIVTVLALFMPVWAAALLTGLVVAGIGYAILQKGMSELRQLNPAPERTIETLKEDKEWLNRQMK